MKTSKIVWIVVAVLVIGALLYFYKGSSTSVVNTVAINKGSPVVTTEIPSTSSSSKLAEIPPMTVNVVYGPNGFSPSTVVISKGSKVTFTNKGGDEMWVASNPHPTHEGYSGTTKDKHCPDTTGTAFDQCSAGATYSFTFEKVGTWGYHNHGNASDKGTIIVK